MLLANSSAENRAKSILQCEGHIKPGKMRSDVGERRRTIGKMIVEAQYIAFVSLEIKAIVNTEDVANNTVTVMN